MTKPTQYTTFWSEAERLAGCNSRTATDAGGSSVTTFNLLIWEMLSEMALDISPL
jgi:hypothetical protein